VSERAQRREVSDTKELLLDAAEHLFARHGIHGTRIREINELAGQRNPSALHYHFGDRAGLVSAIMLRHQSEIDKIVERRLDELERAGRPEVRDVIAAIIEPMTERLRSPSGRSWARIIPQILGSLGENLRRGVAKPATPQSERILNLLQDRISDLPKAVQRERLVDYSIVLATLVADRAHQLDSGRRPSLTEAQFTRHLLDVLEALLTAPTTV
jgi:AcrR family transcriptional regulator